MTRRRERRHYENFQPSFEERVLSELAAIRHEVTQQSAGISSSDARLTSLEEKVDARLRETRPIWEGVQAQLKEIEKQMVKFNRQFKTLVEDSFDQRSRLEKLEDGRPTG